MNILTLRTDKPEAELGLYKDGKQISYEVWEAHRRLAETIHGKISQQLEMQQLTLNDLNGIIVYKGPGSFTGLRIGISVANALAYSLNVPIVATTEDWIEQGLRMLAGDKGNKIAVPEYGQPAHTTSQKK